MKVPAPSAGARGKQTSRATSVTRPRLPSQPTFTEAAQLDMCSAFCYRTRLLSTAYETERIAAVGQGSYLYQNDTGLPDDTGYDDTVTPLKGLSICDEKTSEPVHAGAPEQRQLLIDSHTLLDTHAHEFPSDGIWRQRGNTTFHGIQHASIQD